MRPGLAVVLVAAALFLAFPRANSQESLTPVVLHPALGDTISLVERNRYGIYTAYKGFRWAVAFVTSDSMVVVQVLADGVSGLRFDTLRTRSTLAGVRASVSKLIEAGDRRPSGGSSPRRLVVHEVRLFPKQGPAVVQGELLAVWAGRLAVRVDDLIDRARNTEKYGLVCVYHSGEVNGIEVRGSSSSTGRVVGTICGAVAGGWIGGRLIKERGMFEGLARAGNAAGGVVVGGLVGFGIGYLVDSGGSGNKEVDVSDLETLEEHAKYRGKEGAQVVADTMDLQ